MENTENQAPESAAPAAMPDNYIGEITVEPKNVAETEELTEKPTRPPRPHIEVTDEMVEKASKTLSTMLDYLALEATVKSEKRNSKINLIVASSDAGRIIGRKGQSLESLQILLNRMLQNGKEDFPKVYIDIDGYSSGKNGHSSDAKSAHRSSSERHSRAPRRFEDKDEGKDDILRQQALDAAKEVRRWGEPVTLPKMNSHDRRIIHISLENEPDIQTESTGEGSLKSVTVSLKK